MSNALIFAPQYNTKGRRDATGAFLPEAAAFAKTLGGAAIVTNIDNGPAPAVAAYRQVLDKIDSFRRDSGGKELDMLALFCHGWSRGIQFGFNLSSVEALAGHLEKVASARLAVVFYSCLAGSGPKDAVGGDGGFADRFRDALCRAGLTDCQVDAHTTAGHTTRNPYVRRFEGRGSPVGGVGGYYLVEPGSKLWPKWRAALKSDNSLPGTYAMPLRFAFPRFSVGRLHELLDGWK